MFIFLAAFLTISLVNIAFLIDLRYSPILFSPFQLPFFLFASVFLLLLSVFLSPFYLPTLLLFFPPWQLMIATNLIFLHFLGISFIPLHCSHPCFHDLSPHLPDPIILRHSYFWFLILIEFNEGLLRPFPYNCLGEFYDFPCPSLGGNLTPYM